MKGNTSFHIFTVKIPHFLLAKLEEISRIESKSKGACIRLAVETFVKKKSEGKNAADWASKITEAIIKGKKIPYKPKVDWAELRRLASANAQSSPEEEIALSRRRRL